MSLSIEPYLKNLNTKWLCKIIYMQKIIQEIKFFLNYLREDPYEFIAIVLGVFWLLLLLVGK
nr:MAG TPA: protein of unknown function (DUF883) [Caudoviricetes sp.]